MGQHASHCAGEEWQHRVAAEMTLDPCPEVPGPAFEDQIRSVDQQEDEDLDLERQLKEIESHIQSLQVQLRRRKQAKAPLQQQDPAHDVQAARQSPPSHSEPMLAGSRGDVVEEAGEFPLGVEAKVWYADRAARHSGEQALDRCFHKAQHLASTGVGEASRRLPTLLKATHEAAGPTAGDFPDEGAINDRFQREAYAALGATLPLKLPGSAECARADREESDDSKLTAPPPMFAALELGKASSEDLVVNSSSAQRLVPPLEFGKVFSGHPPAAASVSKASSRDLVIGSVSVQPMVPPLELGKVLRHSQQESPATTAVPASSVASEYLERSSWSTTMAEELPRKFSATVWYGGRATQHRGEQALDRGFHEAQHLAALSAGEAGRRLPRVSKATHESAGSAAGDSIDEGANHNTDKSEAYVALEASLPLKLPGGSAKCSPADHKEPDNSKLTAPVLAWELGKASREDLVINSLSAPPPVPPLELSKAVAVAASEASGEDLAVNSSSALPVVPPLEFGKLRRQSPQESPATNAVPASGAVREDLERSGLGTTPAAPPLVCGQLTHESQAIAAVLHGQGTDEDPPGHSGPGAAPPVPPLDLGRLQAPGRPPLESGKAPGVHGKETRDAPTAPQAKASTGAHMQQQGGRSAQAIRDERLSCERAEAFLLAHGFRGVCAQKKRLFGHTYPLHLSVMQNDAGMVRALLVARADPAQRDSAGRTPYQLAVRRSGKIKSHEEVIAVLAASSTEEGQVEYGRSSSAEARTFKT